MGIEGRRPPVLKEEVTRRGALGFLGNVAAFLAATKVGLDIGHEAIASTEKTNDLEKQTLDNIAMFEANFGKNGPGTRLSEHGEDAGEKLTGEKMSGYLHAMSSIGAALNSARDRDSMPGLEKYISRDESRGLKSHPPSPETIARIMAKVPAGTEAPKVSFNSQFISRRGKKYEVTSMHADATYFRIPGGPDVGIRPAPDYRGETTNYDGDHAEEDFSGKIGVVVANDAHGKEQRFHTPFIRTTLPLLRIIDPLIASLLHTHMCILPPGLSGKGEYDKTAAKGISGGASGVFEQPGSLVPTGPFSFTIDVALAGKKFAGETLTIGFVATRKSVIDTIDAFEKSESSKLSRTSSL
jgi:hypothetical protein